MPGAEGSEEPVQSPDTVLGSDSTDKSAVWTKRSEGYQHHHQQQHHHNHHHNESVSTSASDSANSSPTTTASTVDDSSATEMSPGSSPESPMAKPFLSSFPVTQQPRPKTSDNERLHSSMPLIDAQRPTTPGRRPRNLKNLAVNTSGTSHMARAASTTSLPMATSLKDNSELDVASRSFSKPPSPPKRRPTNLGLTILTPASTKPLPQNVRVAVPPTPSFARPNMLRHFQSSPSLPIQTSSKVIDSTATMLTEQTSSFQKLTLSPPLKIDDSEPNFDIPLSKEEKPEAYPNGPICVYGPQLDLYLEPTAEQALNYDVIMNVASEVRNPFDHVPNEHEVTPDIRLDGGGGIQYAPRRPFPFTSKPTAHGDALSPVLESSPITSEALSPRHVADSAQGSATTKREQPEYIHIPWEHNTDIVPDLLRLVKVIDDRVSAGKRVLIHCQCGVSRSATLVVAYVIYKNPSMSVQEAYDTVKSRSKWIGPNMNLIMQLQEFRTALMRPMGRFASPRGLSPISPSLPVSDWGRPGPHAPGAGEDETPPNTAPLPMHKRLSAALTTNGDLKAISPGPSSAPSGIAWPSHTDAVAAVPQEVPLQSQDSAYVDPSGNVVPVVKIIEEPQSSALKAPRITKDRPHSLNLDNHTRHDSGRHIAPLPPRFAEFAMGPLQPSEEVDSADTFGLMSPTATDFSHSPLDRDTLLSALGMGSALQQPTRPPHLSTKTERAPLSTDSHPTLTLKPKLSAPSLRERRQLQAMQSQIEASLAHQTSSGNTEKVDLEALMSPRAFEFTQNPFALAVNDTKTTATVPEGDDPRSPAQKGVSLITRNIFDVL